MYQIRGTRIASIPFDYTHFYDMQKRYGKVIINRTTKEHDLKDSNIFYVSVPNKLTSDVNHNSFDTINFYFPSIQN